MQTIPLSASRVFTVEGGRLAAFAGCETARHMTGDSIVSDALTLPITAARSGVAFDARAPLTRDSMRSKAITGARAGAAARWKALRAAARDALGMGPTASDAFTVTPQGAPLIDLVGTLEEVAMMPRPAATFDDAFPDRIAFNPGEEQVQGHTIIHSGRPLVGWRGSLADIPSFKLGSVATMLNTVSVVYSVPFTLQDAWGAQVSRAVLDAPSRLSVAMGEVDLTISAVRWSGSTAAGISGVLNHPYLSRSQDLDINLNTSTYGAIYTAFINAAHYIRATSQGVGRVDTVVMSPEVEKRLHALREDSGESRSLLAVLDDEFRAIGITRRSDQVYSNLDDVGGTDVHGVLFYNRSQRLHAPAALSGLEATAFPYTVHPLAGEVFIVARIGDVHLWNATSILLTEWDCS